MNDNLNLTMLTDFYEITMANGYFESGMKDDIAYFDMFFRKVPDGGGYAIMAGVEQVIEYLNDLKFTDCDIEYLRDKKMFSEGFLEYLRNFKFACDIWTVPEGTPIFPDEPLLTVRGPMIQAQFIETMILLLINHQSLIATKANRIVRAADGRGVMEFGTRRAHGPSAAIYGARAAYIGGCADTACVRADCDHNIPALGTMAHSWVQMFDTEYEAFRKYAEIYPQNCVLLVDTYNVLKSGVPNAIRVFRETDPQIKGIRIDSGDIAYLTKQARKMLDDAGFEDCQIVVSNALDEYLISNMLMQGACIDSFGVGERLITAKSDSVFGGVYKLSAVEKDGRVIPKMKVSENIEKITNPGFKKVYRIYDKGTDRAIADVITLENESIPERDGYVIFDPKAVWKKKTLKNFYARDLREQIFREGKCVYKSPSVKEIRQRCETELGKLWEELLRYENPHNYFVDLSTGLWRLKQDLLDKYEAEVE